MIALRRISIQLFLIALVFVGAAALQVFAFSEPSDTPPAGDVADPITTGPTSQNKADTSASHAAWITSDGLGSRYGALLATQGGSVGVGTTSPQATLDINGALRIGYDSTTCGSSTSGALRYNTSSASSTLQFCDGSSWQTVSTTN